MSEDRPARLYQALVNQDPAAAIGVIESVKNEGFAQAQLFDALFVPAMSMLGGAWASGAVDEYAFTQAAVVAEQIQSFVQPPPQAADSGVTILVGCMQGDVHAIGKNVIAAALKDAGHRVVDLGVDVRPAEFLERLDETGSRFVVVCAETTAAARDVRRVRDMFDQAAHPEVVILASGGPFVAEPSLARHSGANGVVGGAESAVKLVARVVRDVLVAVDKGA